MNLSGRFGEALVYACWLHSEQSRKGSGVPYTAHLLAVTAIALEHGADEDEAIAALLHDAIEDQGGAATRQEIFHRFGARVTEIVEGCTDADFVPKPPWRKRKQEFLDALPTASASVHLVVAADKLHNAQSLLADYRQVGEELWLRFTGGRDGTLWYYRSIATILFQARASKLVAELDRVVAELEQLAAAQKPK